jgi:hypothetical protein
VNRQLRCGVAAQYEAPDCCHAAGQLVVDLHPYLPRDKLLNSLLVVMATMGWAATVRR